MKVKIFYISQNFHNFNRFSLIYFIFLLKINIILNECSRDYPLRYYYSKTNTECVSRCFTTDYERKKCFLENSIIKVQYPNNIIFIGGQLMKYFNSFTFSNGDFIFETFSSSYEKVFYGLKKNGRNYFNNSENKPFYYLNTKSNKEIYGYISNSMFIKKWRRIFVKYD